MTRKSKQPGGHNPLTYAETKRLKSSGYGTQSTRLTSQSMLPFGHCCLSLSQIEGDAVATPSGHIYSRETIVQYLLTKNRELKEQKADYERKRLQVENRRAEWEEKQQKKSQQQFRSKDQGAMSNALVVRDDGGEEKETKTENSLSHVSYWLSSSQPNATAAANSGDDFDYEKEIMALPSPPPDRPPSPMSGEPLKLKQLIPIHLVHEQDEGISNNGERVLCSVSHKRITTQDAVAIKSSGQVMLKSVFDELAKPSMTCPVTGKKFKDKDVITLVKGKSGFAASGNVEAKKYNPTLT
jgi:nitric oxide synthase-interacting protein